MFIGIGIGIPFSRVLGGIGTTIAQNHHARVIADGGVMPVTAAELASLLNPICTAYNITTTAQFNTQLPTFKDPHWTGYRAGAGAGVTLGQAAQVVYSINPAADAVITTAASQPLLLAWSGENYWYGSGVAGNFVSTPNNANNQLIGNFAIEAKLKSNSTTTFQCISGKHEAGGLNSSYIFRITNTNNLQLFVSQGSSDFTYTSTLSLPFAANSVFHVRVSRNLTTGIISFFTSTNGVDYTQLGSNIVGVTGNLNNPNIISQIGSIVSGAANNFNGEIFNVKIFKDSTFTTPTQIFNPQLYNAATSQTQWTAATGEVWTINTGTADTGNKGVLVDRTRVQYNGTSHVMRAASFSVNTPTITMYSGFRKFTNAVTANGILAELGTNAGTSNGFFLAMNNGIASTETAGCYASILNARAYSSNSLLRKITTTTYQTLIPDPETDYAVNNIAASSILTIGSGNNTANINQSALNLGARNNGASLFANIGLDSLVVSITNDTTAQRLVMFNTLRTMNRL